jgi:hypothetical protein
MGAGLMDRPTLGRFKCPGCSCHYSVPPRPEPIAVDLSCKHCGHKDTRLDPDYRVCEECGVCGVCGASHTVMVRGSVKL